MIVKGQGCQAVFMFLSMTQEITFQDAEHIWGKETGETVKAIREELGERYESEIRVLSIRTAGEHLVSTAHRARWHVLAPDVPAAAR